MIDPVIQDLNRYLHQLDQQDALEAHAEDLRGEHPNLSEEDLLDLAESDLRERRADHDLDFEDFLDWEERHGTP